MGKDLKKLKKLATWLSGEKHCNQENSLCQGPRVRKCLVCLKSRESQCSWSRKDRDER